MDSSEFECIVCQQQCNDTDRQPMKVCEEEHWVCNLCLFDLQQKNPCCPFCKTPFPENIKKFRTLLNLKRMWDESKLNSNISKSEFKEKKQKLEERVYKSEVKFQQPKQNFVKCLPKEIQQIPKEELKKEKVQPQVEILKCEKNHPLTKTTSLPAPYPNNRYRCNGCRQGKIASLNNEVWHCGKCNYDLCKLCSSNQNRSSLKCDAKHSLFKVANLDLPYIMNRYRCNRCKQLKISSMKDQVWHCHACHYDLCKQCATKN